MPKWTEYAHEADFQFYADPGHGWLKVTSADLRDVGLTVTDFSAQGGFVQYAKSRFFLEEDCDAPQFIEAWERKRGRPMVILEHVIDNRRQLGII